MRRLVGAHAEQTGMPKLAVYRPFHERDRNDDFGSYPVHVEPRQTDRFGEGRLGALESGKTLAEIEQELRVEASADLTGEDEVVSLEVANEQSAEAEPTTSRIGEAADHELLGSFDLHLQPVSDRKSVV